MPPKKRGRPPKDKGENPPPAKKPKQPTKISVIDPSPVTNQPGTSKQNPPVTTKKASVSSKVNRKIKVLNSNVHKEFDQESKEDGNGNIVWTSKCKHCPPGQGEYSDRRQV